MNVYLIIVWGPYVAELTITMCTELRDLYVAYLHGENILHEVENVSLPKVIDGAVCRVVEWLQDI